MKNILVTGGAGFIGSNFVHYILDKYSSYNLFVFDKLTYAGNLDNLRELQDNPRYVFVHGDIADRETVNETVITHQI
ncbi:MAG: GDP-mannose 4,6-dehydratase, partial [Anaerolineales bacterium]|nr:GDP-mannose 4,6-dehydratase [Anaerolineales bacterium]